MDNPVPETPKPPEPPTIEKPADFLPKAEPQVGFPQPSVPVAPPEQPIQPTPPTPASDYTGILPGSEKPKSKNNLLMVVAIVLLLVALTVLGFFIFQNIQKRQTPAETTPTPTASPTPTPDPTANWKTYTNTKYLYSFKHPSDYIVGQNGVNSLTPETVEDIVVYNPNSKTLVDDPRLSTSVVQKGGMTLQAIAQAHFNKISTYKLTANPTFPSYKSNSIVIAFTKTTFLDEEAYTFTITGSYYEDGAAEGVSSPRERKYIWVDNTNNYFLIRIDKDSLMDQILSTFKFMGPTPTETIPTSSPSASPTATP